MVFQRKKYRNIKKIKINNKNEPKMLSQTKIVIGIVGVVGVVTFFCVQRKADPEMDNFKANHLAYRYQIDFWTAIDRLNGHHRRNNKPQTNEIEIKALNYWPFWAEWQFFDAFVFVSIRVRVNAADGVLRWECDWA